MLKWVLIAIPGVFGTKMGAYIAGCLVLKECLYRVFQWC